MTIQEIKLLKYDGYYSLTLVRDNIRFLVKFISTYYDNLSGRISVEVETPQRDKYSVLPKDLSLIDEETAIRFKSLTGWKE